MNGDLGISVSMQGLSNLIQAVELVEYIKPRKVVSAQYGHFSFSHSELHHLSMPRGKFEYEVDLLAYKTRFSPVAVLLIAISPQLLSLILGDGEIPPPEAFFPVVINLFPRVAHIEFLVRLNDEDFVSVPLEVHWRLETDLLELNSTRWY